MALRRSLWVGVPVAAAAVWAVAVLPPRPFPDTPGPLWGGVWIGGGIRYLGRGSVLERDAKAAIAVLGNRVDEARVGDSLLALAGGDPTALRSDDGLVTVLFDPSSPPQTARRVLEDAARELALYPRVDGPTMRAIVAVYTDTVRHRDIRHDWWRRRAYVRGSACIVELNRARGRQPSYRRVGGWPLDGCALFVRFGPRGPVAPGRLVRTAGLLQDRSSWWQSSLTDQLIYARRRELPRPAPWERRSWPSSSRNGDRWLPFPVPFFQWEWSACLWGSDSSCLRALGVFGRQRSNWYGRWGNPFVGQSLVADLLATQEAHRFATFWRSDLPDVQALEMAYGKPLGSLIRDAVSRSWTPQPRGPHITGRVVTAAFGWVVAALGLAVAAGRRRQARS